MDRKDVVYSMLEDDWLSTNQIKTKVSIHHDIVLKVLKKLRDEGKVEYMKLKNARYWKKSDKDADI